MADEIELPTVADLKKLPRRAKMAFAARCGRRAQPLLTLHWPDAPAEHVAGIERALAMIATFCRAKREDAAATRVRTAAFTTIRKAIGGALWAAAFDGPSDPDGADADAAVSATDYALSSAMFRPGSVAHYAANAGVAASYAAGHDIRMIEAIAADYQNLLAKAKRLKWTDASAVDPDALGPLWPKPPGEPDWAAALGYRKPIRRRSSKTAPNSASKSPRKTRDGS